MIQTFLCYRFTVYNIPSERKFSVDASIKICFEANTDTCINEYLILDNINILYANCSNSVTRPFGGK